MKKVSTDILYRIIHLSPDCTNPVEKDPICQIKLENFIILSTTMSQMISIVSVVATFGRNQ